MGFNSAFKGLIVNKNRRDAPNYSNNEPAPQHNTTLRGPIRPLRMTKEPEPSTRYPAYCIRKIPPLKPSYPPQYEQDILQERNDTTQQQPPTYTEQFIDDSRIAPTFVNEISPPPPPPPKNPVDVTKLPPTHSTGFNGKYS
jgi:hypothetical protein